MAVVKAKTSLSSGESIAKVVALTNLGATYEASVQEIAAAADNKSLSEIAWGVEIDQSRSTNNVTGVGNYSLWNEYKSGIGRFQVSDSGAAVKLNPNNSAQYANGTTVDTTKGQIMTVFPRLYYRVVKNPLNAKKFTLWASKSPIGGNYIERRAIASYFSYLDGGKLTSKPNVVPTKLSNNSLSTFNNLRGAIVPHGADWGINDWDGWRLLQMLYLFEKKTLNSQTSLGTGICSTSTSEDTTTKTGATSSLGDATGTSSSRISLFGIEDPYGFLFEVIQGLVMDPNDFKFYAYAGNRFLTDTEFSGSIAGEYRVLQGREIQTNSFGTEMLIGDYFDTIATIFSGGSSTTYWCDQVYFKTDGTNNNIKYPVMVGGGSISSPSGAQGMFYMRSINTPTQVMNSTLAGVRLAYYGPITIVEPSAL